MAAIFLGKAGTKYLREVARYLFFAWLGEFSHCWRYLAQLYGLDGLDGLDEGFSMLFNVVGTGSTAISLCLIFKLQLELILGFRKSVLLSLGEQRLLQSLKAMILTFVMVFPLGCLANAGRLDLGEAHFATVALSFFVLLTLALEVVQIALGMLALRKVLRLATYAKDETRGAECIARLEQGHRAIRLQYMRLAGTWPCCILLQVMYVLAKGWLWPIPSMIFMEENILIAVAQFIMCLLAVWGSDGLNGALANGEVKALTEMEQLEKRVRSVQTYEFDSDKGWQEKVEEMGCRGLSLLALLEFYQSLGKDHMPHFNPAFHTTNDVVREAIIPLTSKTKQALAVQIHGRPKRPTKMITHNWGNLFADLVAVAIADALGEFTYGKIAKLLGHSPEKVLEWLEASGKMHETVWICAFSVNQHLSICDRNMGHGRDSVTQLEYPVCHCACPKFMNDSEPRRSDGSSILCEMNKFDDMMAWLAATDRNFHQVIAVDQDFELFSRAWCVAEIAEASGFGMGQRLLVASAWHLERHTPKLRNLRVQGMKASRPEDVTVILAKIPDKDEFNQMLQHLIFDRLLTNWNVLDIAEKLNLAGHMARWQNAARDLNKFHMDSNLLDDCNDRSRAALPNDEDKPEPVHASNPPVLLARSLIGKAIVTDARRL